MTSRSRTQKQHTQGPTVSALWCVQRPMSEKRLGTKSYTVLPAAIASFANLEDT